VIGGAFDILSHGSPFSLSGQFLWVSSSRLRAMA
jgi:hypothetical protein